MQKKQGFTELLVLSGIAHDGHVAWMFVPGGWNIAELEQCFPFTDHAGVPRRQVLVSVDVARELADRYGGSPLLELPDSSSLSDLLSDGTIAVKLLIARDQDATASAIPL
ncbi:hypothetical protein EGT29_11695 [Pigmentiphaga sp. H8]|uniref:hypothetical protein n=1 Tax=Pigmentiphaga sp. H8 TaxID=2488560 RepID=UPI000F59E808|nr:hypothetical protein [Pigmentiphaga sp. H8]AZG08463.1 hypothetical protein EGT29_11695 [Pigmentiphaga sp. H8]